MAKQSWERLLARCAVGALLSAAPALSSAIAAELAAAIELNGTTTPSDDFLCWAPVSARIKLLSTQASPVSVTLTAQADRDGGAVAFQADQGTRPKRGTFSGSQSLTISLPGTGAWVPFWVAGTRASAGEKDVRISAIADGRSIGQLPVMVRVRKDAETLTTREIDQFLRAVAAVHRLRNGGVGSEWMKHVRAHEQAFGVGIHGTPMFLAWHRAFILGVERELQAIDPRVALPYWRFDRPAPGLFTPEFMGRVPGGASSPGAHRVEFAPNNPIFGWQVFDNAGGLVRANNGDRDAPVPPQAIEAVMGLESYAVFGDEIEGPYHGWAHSGIGGWLTSRSSPRDPLFYLLHANVDRAWAHWQARHGTFDPSGPDGSRSYSPTGSYPGTTVVLRYPKGAYAQDTMWPWNGLGGDQGNQDRGDDWPPDAYELPAAANGTGPERPPTPAAMVDYLDTRGRGLVQGACYDDIDLHGRNPRQAN